MGIRWLGEIGPGDADLVGGKAAGLGRLIRHGVPVPGGFVVTTEAYADHAERCGLVAALGPLIEGGDPAAVAEAAGRLLRMGPPAERTVGPLLDAYHAMGSPRVAVRSSATAEDLVDASFAGQHDTLLDVRGDDAVLRAVAACWASLWTERAVRYRRERSIDPLSAAMAVVVQEMVDAEVSGVLFTVDPVTMRPDRMQLTVATGTGEAVVSGAAPGATCTVDRATLAVAEGSPDGPPLGPERVAALGRLALEIEGHLGRPQDLEFAFAGGVLHVLQARPITTLGESLPEPLPPLGKPSLVDETMRPLAAERYVTAPRPLDNLTYTRVVGAAMYVVQQEGGVIAPADAAAFRAQVWRQAYRLPRVRLTWRTLLAQRSYLRILRTDWQAWWDAGPRDALRAVSSPVDLSVLGDREILERADRILAAWEEPMNRRFHAASAIQALPWLGLLVGLAVGPWRRAGVMADLMAGIETPTGEVNDALWDLSRLARRDPGVLAAVRNPGPTPLPATAEGRAFGEVFRGFLDRYGHREGACFYLSTPTWRRDPSQVLRLLAAMAEADGRTGSPGEARARYGAARALVERRLRWVPRLRTRFARLLERFRALDAFRESSHFDLTRPLAALQDIAAEWGRRLVERGVLEDAGDVFWLTPDEVRAWLPAPAAAPSDVRELLARRRATWRVANARWQTERMRGGVRGEALRGTPASAGTARGRVRVVRSERQFHRLRPGEVLVCPYSNPAWTPLFVSASAVVSETGGAASHAAIVAREYGIPAVLGVRGATRALRDGEEVLVDGESGRVLRVRGGRGRKAGAAGGAAAGGGA